MKKTKIIFLLLLSIFSVQHGLQALSLEEFENAIVKITENASPSIVTVEAVKKTSFLSHPLEFEDILAFQPAGFSRNVTSLAIRHRQKQQGTGFIVREDGYIITSSRLTDGACSLEVTLKDGKKYNAVSVGCDSEKDIALIKMHTDSKLPALELLNRNEIIAGKLAIAPSAFPAGGYAVSLGTMGSPGILPGLSFPCIFSNAITGTEKAGAPLLSINGKAAGMCSYAKADTSFPAFNNCVMFAVPSYILKEFIEKSIASYFAVKTSGGLELKTFGIILEQRSDGVYISKVITGSPAWLANLKKGMKINSVNNRQVNDLKAAEKASAEHSRRVDLYLDDRSSRYFIILNRQ